MSTAKTEMLHLHAMLLKFLPDDHRTTLYYYAATATAAVLYLRPPQYHTI